MPQRLFTIEEANALLPALRELLAETQARKRELDTASALLETELERSSGNGHGMSAEMAVARGKTQEEARALEALLGRIDELGCELKGIDEGLIDFRSMRDGRVVYLCWRLGEESIGYWHDLETGFAGRQPL